MKKITVLLLSMLMVWKLGITGYAASGQSFIETTYQEKEDLLELICAISGETGGKESFEVMLADQKLPVNFVSALGREPVSKSVYCLVDISGSMKERMAQVKETLLALAGGLHEGDNLVIGKMGNQITDSVVLTNPKKIKAEIEKLTYTGEDTDLYSGIIHGLNYLQQEREIHRVKALVVLSDGCDDQGDGSTWREAYDAVEKADIPVYTAVPLLSADDYEKAKELGSFSRNSAGGMHLPLSDESGSAPAAMTGTEMGKAILKALDDTFHIQVRLDGIEKTENTCRLSVVFHSETGRTYQDSLEIAGRDLKLSEKKTDTDTVSDTDSRQKAADPETDISDINPDIDADKIPWLAVCLAGLAAAAVLVAVLAAVLQKRKQMRLKKEKEENEENEKRILEEQQKNARMEQEAARRKAMEQMQALARQKQEAFQALAKLSIRLSAVGIKNKECTLELAKGCETTVGRNAKAAVVLDSQDTRLSGVHFVLYWDGRRVYAWDRQSKNGTTVNGVVINKLGRVMVEPGDSIRAGSYEYRLYWEER